MNFLLVYDVEGWAFHRWAKGVVENHGTDHTIKMVSGAGLAEEFNTWEKIQHWDAVLNFSWYEASLKYGQNRCLSMVAHHGYQLPYTEDPFQKVKDWRLLGATRHRNSANADKLLKRFDGLLAANRFIETNLKELGYRCWYAPGGVDHKLFMPEPFTNEKFTVGWCAQHDPDHPNNKGWRVLLKVREHFRGTSVVFKIQNASHDSEPLKPHEMPTFYNSIDCFLVTSVSEGTPLTAQEAMSCGRPVIGPKVGILPELIDHKANGVLVPPCLNDATAIETVTHMVAWIEKLSKERELSRYMGDSARAEILANWTWRDRAQDYVEALEGVVNG